jgi:hypothetical protein
LWEAVATGIELELRLSVCIVDDFPLALPFAGEAAWEIDGKEALYSRGRIERWEARRLRLRRSRARPQTLRPLWTAPLGYLSNGPS